MPLPPASHLILRRQFTGCSGSFLVAQTGGGGATGRVLLALVVLLGLGVLLLVFFLALSLLTRSRGRRLLDEAQRRQRSDPDLGAWEEAGRRLDLDEQARRDYENG